MCLVIPGKIIESVDFEHHIAKVDVSGVRRNINIGILAANATNIGDYVLIHVSFATSKIDEHEAAETLRLLKEIDLFEDEVEQFKATLE